MLPKTNGVLLDVAQIRKDFPILTRKIHGKPLAYLDNAATTQKPISVIKAFERYYEHSNANVHRGIHLLAEEATALYENTRAEVAQFLGAKNSSSIVFTRNATESINFVASAWGRDHVKAGDEVIISAMEHHSNIVPWQVLCQDQGAKLQVVGIDAQGHLDLEAFQKMLSPRTKIVAMTQVSNVLGTINPIEKIIALAHQAGALVLVDGAQSAPHMRVNVSQMDCDFFVCSSHKMLGPMGVGVLYGKPEQLESMRPFITGGEMIKEVTFAKTTWNEIPWKFEAGTPNVSGVLAFGKALQYLQDVGLERVRAHEELLTQKAMDALKQLEDAKIFGPESVEERGGVISFSFAGIHPHDLGTLLDREGVAVRAGHHCAQPLMRILQVPATTRASFYLYNTTEEIDQFIAALQKARHFFRSSRKTTSG